MMEAIFAAVPLKINPIYSLPILLGMAYFPHILKKSYLQKKLKEHGKVYATANSRGLSASMIDGTPAGLKIANLAGCHENGLEAFSYYSAAVICCLITNVDREALGGAAALFIAIRVAYTYVYMSDFNGPPRTYLFFLGLALNLALFVSAGVRYSA